MAPQSEMDKDLLFRALISTSADGIMVIDEGGRVLVYSDACKRLFGYAPEEVVGQNVKMLMPEPYHAEHDGYIRHYKETGERHIIGIGREVVGRRKDGTTFPMYLSVGDGTYADKRIFVGIVHDISLDRQRDQTIRELQHELVHSTRVTAMGQMSSAIAHELNQPLSTILAYAGAMKRLIGNDNPDLREALEETAKAAARAGDIIRRLRSFVEKRTPNRTPESVPVLVSEAMALGSIGLRSDGIKISVTIQDGLMPVYIDKVQIQQVLVNLIRNAAEAMNGCATQELTITAERVGDENVVVSICDTGPGIADEIAAHLFQPFATTKEQGMGMGLNICRTIIEAHEGRIWADPNPSGGTTFRFRLPTANGTA